MTPDIYTHVASPSVVGWPSCSVRACSGKAQIALQTPQAKVRRLPKLSRPVRTIALTKIKRVSENILPSALIKTAHLPTAKLHWASDSAGLDPNQEISRCGRAADNVALAVKIRSYVRSNVTDFLRNTVQVFHSAIV